LLAYHLRSNADGVHPLAWNALHAHRESVFPSVIERMIRMNKTAAILLVCILMAFMVPVLAESTGILAQGNWKYSLDGENAVLLGPADKGIESAKIPAALDRHPVIAIGDSCFMQCTELRSVSIPEGITAIGNWAFGYCSKLESIDFPDSLGKIGYAAFDSCGSLKSVTIPNGVELIDFRAFSNCLSLSRISADPRNRLFHTQADVLYTADGILHTYPANKQNVSYSVPAGTAGIGANAFYGNTCLQSLELPGSLLSIAPYAFAFCRKLTAPVIPAGVAFIGNGAFMDCETIAAFDVDQGNLVYESKDGVLFDKNRSMLQTYPFGRTDAFYAIPEGTALVGDWSFANCAVESVAFPRSITAVGTYAFLSCVNMVTVTLQPGLTELGNGAFSGCGSLAQISLPEGLASIGDSAFSNCSNLKELRIPDSVTGFGWMPFQGSDALTLLVKGTSAALSYARENGIPYTVITE
jgi:hypothetical protein